MPTPLETLDGLLAPDMTVVNRLIVERMDSPVSLIPQLAGYLVNAGGKRIRPLLTLAAARLCGFGEGDEHAKLAACVEFIHTATLLHDDVVDGSEERRGRPSANLVFGNKASVLVGDFLFSRAFELMVSVGSLEILTVLSRASARIAEGEVLQLLATSDLETDEARYLEIIRGKTAVLFAAAAQVGAQVAGRDGDTVERLRTYGEALGIAFQIADDALDYAADRQRLGKAVGDDFRDGKVTLPVILAYADGSADDRAFWQRCIGDSGGEAGLSDEDLAQAIALIHQHQGIERALAAASIHAKRAAEALAPLVDGSAAQSEVGGALVGLARYVVTRDH